MAVFENSKPKTEKTSASVTSTFPRLCPTTKLNLKDSVCNTLKVKSQTQRNRAVSDENQKSPKLEDPIKKNFQKSKLTNTDLSDQGITNITLGLLVSPRNYHGQIPVLSKHSLNHFRMSPPLTRSPSPLKKLTQKEKTSNKIKTITLEQETKKKWKPHNSRSPSPNKQTMITCKKPNTRTASSPVTGRSKTSEKMIKQAESTKTSPRDSPSKRKSKVLNSPKRKSGKDSQRMEGETIVLKQASHPSLFVNEKKIPPHEKISLDHIKNEVYTGDHRRLSLEKVHLCIEQTMENYNMAERKRSYLVRYSSEELQKQDEISLSFLKNMSASDITNFTNDIDQRSIKSDDRGAPAIRTLSGHELILTPSMNLDIEKEEVDSLEISQLLQHHVDTHEDKTDVHIPQDDENEYDSEVSTDGEAEGTKRRNSFHDGKSGEIQSANSLWKSREADLLNDVDYRQSVYHPAVSRRQKSEDRQMESRLKSKSIEDNFPNKAGKRITRSHSSHLNNKYMSQCFAMDKLVSCDNDRSWVPDFDKADERQMYSVIPDVPFFGMKRIRTKKERISGAVLRLTLKVIRLLAIFNLWPGDNCYMLTSQSLRFAR